MITVYHVTSRDRAAQILAEGFTADQVYPVGPGLYGVRLMDDPCRNTNPSLRFQVTGLAMDGVAIPAWILQELQQAGGTEDPRDWEPLPVMPIHDPLGMTVLEFYSLPTLDEPAGEFYGRTEAVEVAADYDETLSYEVEGNGPPVGYVLVFTRDKGSAQYRQTDRFDFPIPTVGAK